MRSLPISKLINLINRASGSTSTSDVPGTLENYIHTHVDSHVHVPLLVVTREVLKQLIEVTKKVEESLSNYSNKSISIYFNFPANCLPVIMSRWRNELIGRT